jgi:thymidylate synthase (FAD)
LVTPRNCTGDAGSNPVLTTNQTTMKVQLINITPNAEKHIAEVARVSSSRSDKQSDYAGLINYLMKHKHWSPFEHAYVTFEIETSKAIGIQLIRHRSFTFQEFSQRYQDVNLLGDMFETIELRKQCENNRQSSTEMFSPKIEVAGGVIEAQHLIQEHLLLSEKLYNELISAGVAREQARMVLPMCTKTKIHMTGSIRSWIHFLDLRDDVHAQKEIQLVAKEMRSYLSKELPIIFGND